MAGAAPPVLAPVGNFGTNNRDLPEEVSSALLELCRDLEAAAQQHREEQVRDAMQARYFWRGYHFIWWAEGERRWKIAGIDPTPPGVTLPRYDYVTNIFRSYGLSFIAVVSEGKLNVRFFPQNAKEQADLDTAEAASTIGDLIERNNHMDDLSTVEGYLLWVDGFLAYHIDYVVDGEKHGYDEVTEMTEGSAELTPDSMMCPECGMASPPDGSVESQGAQPCPECQFPMTGEDLAPAVSVPVPVPAGTRKMPRGQEVIRLLSRLDVITPPYATELSEMGHLSWPMEIHRAKLAATYPEKAETIRKRSASDATLAGGTASRSGAVNATQEDEFERRARMRARSTTLHQDRADDALITFRRTWLRPWVFEELPTDDAKQRRVKATLQRLFPDGAKVCYFGDVYLESYNESMDDVWELAHAMPGEGNTRDGIGKDEISVQRRQTTVDNLQIETYERGISASFVDSETVDLPGFTASPTVPGALYAARGRPGLPLGASFHDTPPARVSEQAIEHGRELQYGTSQQTTGIYPAIYGGDTGANDTARGIMIQRNQAKGRIGVFYRVLKHARAAVLLKGVECFKKHRLDDVEFSLFDPATRLFTSKTVHVDDLKGLIWAHPETEENYPTSWPEKQAQANELLINPVTQPIAMLPANAGVLQRMIGMGDIEFPGAAARAKQMREIEAMLAGAFGGPQVVMQPDINTGAPVAVQRSSIMPDLLLDDHAAEHQACVDWATSDAGILARIQNPLGFLDVKLHDEMHFQMLQQVAAALAPPAPGPPAGGGGDGKSKSDFSHLSGANE